MPRPGLVADAPTGRAAAIRFRAGFVESGQGGDCMGDPSWLCLPLGPGRVVQDR